MTFITQLSNYDANPVLFDGIQSTDAEALYKEVRQTQQWLVHMGAKAGDKLALWLPNHSRWLSTFIACAELDIAVLTINTRFKSTELEDLLLRSECQWLVLWPEFKDIAFIDILKNVAPHVINQLQGILSIGAVQALQHAFPKLLVHDLRHAPPHIDIPSSNTNEAIGLIYTTSGTTSKPKFVAHTKQGLLKHGEHVAQHFKITQQSVVLLTAPLCGAFGFSAALGALHAGATLIAPASFNAEETAALIKDWQVTHTFANNEVIAQLLEKGTKQQNPPFPSLKCVGFASFAPSLGNLPIRAEQAGIRLIGLYGSSELQALCAAQNPNQADNIRLKAGGELVAKSGQVRSRCVESGKILPHNELGEIEIKAPSLMHSYLNDPQATADALTPDGFFKTGDIGYTLANNAFIFEARKGNYIRLNGFLVNPIEIESHIEAIEGVQAVQVVGAQENDKTVCVAFIICKAAATLTSTLIQEHCKKHMAGFKSPKYVFFIDEFPVVVSANSNKIKTNELIEKANQRIAYLLKNEKQQS